MKPPETQSLFQPLEALINRSPTDWSGWLASVLPPDTPLHPLAVALLVLGLAILPLARPSRSVLARWLLSATAASALVVAVLSAIRLLPEKGIEAWVFSVLFLAVGFTFFAKLALMLRFSNLRDARAVGVPSSQVLANQRRALDMLLDQANRSATPLAMGLEAEWGMGKSMVVEHLLHELEHPPRGRKAFVAVKVNIWEYESYGDLQWGVMQALLAHPRALERFGWLTYPVWALAREWGHLRFHRFEINLGGHKANADGLLHLPWQAEVERLVGRLRHRDFNVAIVLDEIDRADACTSQCALTLLHRSLCLPGVVAVVPFVQRTIQLKVFHPANLCQPDLLDTAIGWLEWEQVFSKQGVVPANGVQEKFEVLPSPHESQRERLARLCTHVLKDRFMLRRYLEQMEERYLKMRVKITPLAPDDLRDFLGVPEIAVLLERFEPAAVAQLPGWVAQGWVPSGPKRTFTLAQRLARCTLRSLRGELMNVSSFAQKNVPPRFALNLAIRLASN